MLTTIGPTWPVKTLLQRTIMNLLENTGGVHDGAPHQCPLDELASIYADVRLQLMTSRIEALAERM